MNQSFKPILLVLGLLCFSLSAWAQRSISGTVTASDSGEPLIGASVIVEGTSTGAITDLDGRYTISAPADATLLFSYTGYEPQSIKIGVSNIIDVALGEGVNLDQVVVTALGISREKKGLGYAVQEVNNEDLTQGNEANLVDGLQGRVAGVQINSSSGAPGAGSNITIRGIRSFNNDNQPLFVIDGVPVSNSTVSGNMLPSSGSNSPSSSEQTSFTNRIADVNPADIESVSILKGPAASALYGIRASNGVVVITTKKGKAGRAQVTLNSSFGVEDLAKAPRYQTKYREGRFGRLRFRSNGNPLRFQSFGPAVVEGKTPVFDVIDDFFVTGERQDHSVSINGGNERATYASSFGYFRHEGIIPFADWDRFTGRLSGNLKVSDKVKVNAGVNYSNSGGVKPHSGDKSIMSALSYHPTSFDVNDYINKDGSMKDYSDGIIDNPRYLAEFSTLTDDVDRMIGNIGFSYDPAAWFNLSYTFGVDFYGDARQRIVPAGLDVSSQTGGFIIEQDILSRQLNSTLLATFKTNLSEDLGVEFTVGHDANDRRFELTNVRGEMFAEPSFYHLSNASNYFVGNTKVQQRIFGVLGVLKLSYLDAIYLDVTGRNDWSSTLPTQNRSFFYPSVSLAVVLSDLVKLPDAFTFAKIRGSIAGGANDASPYSVGRYFEADPSFPFSNNASGSVVNGFRLDDVFGDLDLKPETTVETEFGADIRLFSNRFGIDFTWFKQDATDQIIRVPISNTTGFSRFITNAGEIENTGVELLLDVVPVRTKDFEWTASINYSKVEGKVVSIREDIDEIALYGGGFGGITYKFVPGGKVGDLYGFAYERNDNGDLIIAENGFPIVRTDTSVLVGNALPNFTAGLNNQFTYKNLSLSFLLEWRDGGDVYDLGFRNGIRNGVLGFTERRYEEVIFKGVTETGEVNTTPVEITGESLYRSSTRFNRAAENILEDASWFRLRRVTLAYDIPARLLSKNGFISGARFSLTGNNLFLNTPFRGYDPETSYFGSGSNIRGYTGLKTPGTKSVVAAVRLTF